MLCIFGSQELRNFLMNIFADMQLSWKYDLMLNFPDEYMLLVCMPKLPHLALV